MVFVLSLTFFMKILINQEYMLLPVDGMYVVKIVCQASLSFFLALAIVGIFCLDQCQMDVQLSIFVNGRR